MANYVKQQILRFAWFVDWKSHHRFSLICSVVDTLSMRWGRDISEYFANKGRANG